VNTRQKPCESIAITGFLLVVELGGVEPPSESALTQTSPGADGYCGLTPNSLITAQTVARLWIGSSNCSWRVQSSSALTFSTNRRPGPGRGPPG